MLTKQIKYGKRNKLLSVDLSLSELENLKTMGVLEINVPILESFIERTSKLPDYMMLVFFFNENCPHCDNFFGVYEMTFDNARSSNSDVLFFTVNVADDDSVFKKFKIKDLPDVRVKNVS